MEFKGAEMSMSQQIFVNWHQYRMLCCLIYKNVYSKTNYMSVKCHQIKLWVKSTSYKFRLFPIHKWGHGNVLTACAGDKKVLVRATYKQHISIVRIPDLNRLLDFFCHRTVFKEINLYCPSLEQFSNLLN